VIIAYIGSNDFVGDGWYNDEEAVVFLAAYAEMMKAMYASYPGDMTIISVCGGGND
jgi:hypothetical protein